MTSRFGILGAGRVVQGRYVDVFRNELRGASVTSVCDRVGERAAVVSASLGAEATDDMNVLLSRPDVDVVLVATESGAHHQHVVAALRAGKHVIVEKPPALFPAQVEEVGLLAQQQGLMYAVVLQNRLNPAMRALKRVYEQGRFGQIVMAGIRLRWCRYQSYYEDGWHGTWKMDGGVISQQALHHIDGLQWICGPVSELVAAQSNALNRLEAEDTTVATMRFASGTLGSMEATTAARPRDLEASISILGEKGTVTVGGIALNKIEEWRFETAEPEDEFARERYSQDVPTGYGLSHGPLLQEIVDRLSQSRTDAPIGASDSLAVLRTIHALYRSTEVGGWVKLADAPLSSRLGK